MSSVPVDDRAPMTITMYTPDASHDVGITVVCTPGGTASARYFAWAPRGKPLTTSLTAAGMTVVAVDLPGTGRGSGWVDGDLVTVDSVATMLADIATGAAEQGAVVIGLGHSLGAWLTATTEATRRCFDGVCLLGYAPAWRSVPDDLRLPASGAARREAVVAHLAQRDPDLWAQPFVPFPTPLRDECDLYAPVPRALAADFGSTDFATDDCARIEVPVYLGYGSSDVATLRAEVPRYSRAPSVTTYELAGAGHLHAAAHDCALMWGDIARWAGGVRPRPHRDADHDADHAAPHRHGPGDLR